MTVFFCLVFALFIVLAMTKLPIADWTHWQISIRPIDFCIPLHSFSITLLHSVICFHFDKNALVFPNLPMARTTLLFCTFNISPHQLHVCVCVDVAAIQFLIMKHGWNILRLVRIARVLHLTFFIIDILLGKVFFTYRKNG